VTWELLVISSAAEEWRVRTRTQYFVSAEGREKLRARFQGEFEVFSFQFSVWTGDATGVSPCLEAEN
jgi:hypothetical protein